MQKWEYKRIQITGSRYDGHIRIHTVDAIDGTQIKAGEQLDVDRYIQKLGSEGWEMINATDDDIYFKRPIE
jgi:hypothetical protein